MREEHGILAVLRTKCIEKTKATLIFPFAPFLPSLTDSSLLENRTFTPARIPLTSHISQDNAFSQRRNKHQDEVRTFHCSFLFCTSAGHALAPAPHPRRSAGPKSVLKRRQSSQPVHRALSIDRSAILLACLFLRPLLSSFH